MVAHLLSAESRGVTLEGATNFRDLGGYRTTAGHVVRTGLIYRSDSLQDLTPVDVERLLDLRLGEVLDLRSSREVEVFGTTPLTDHGVQRHHIGFLAEPLAAPVAGEPSEPGDHEAIAAHYLDLLEGAKPSVRRAFTSMAEAQTHAVVFHCTAGRDRTGLTAALLLSLLGVDEETIATDYQLTERYLRFPESRLERLRALFGDRITLSAEPPPTPAAAMLGTLAGLAERYGSPQHYLRDAGVDADVAAALRARLLATT